MIASLLLLLSSRLHSRHKDYNSCYVEIWNASKYSFLICIIYSFHLLYCWFHFPYDFYVIEKQVSEYLRDTMKIVENTIDIVQHYDRPAHQLQNHSCIWRWKWLFVFMLNCLLLKNSSMKHSLSIYLLVVNYYYYYILLFL